MINLKTIFKKVAVGTVLALALTSLPISTPTFNTTVAEAATAKISKSKLTLEVGAAKKLTIKNSKDTYTWSSSNKKVAKVSSKGMVTAVKEGKATITATSKKDGTKFTCKVTVTEAKSVSPYANMMYTEQYYSVDDNGYKAEPEENYCGYYDEMGMRKILPTEYSYGIRNSYDKYGNTIKIDKYDIDGNVFGYVEFEYEYDSNGRILAYTEKNLETEEASYGVLEYDEKGNLIGEVVEGYGFRNIACYEYNDKNQEITSMNLYLYEDGGYGYINLYTYNEKGQVESITEFTIGRFEEYSETVVENATPSYTNVYTYDNEGRVATLEYCDASGKAQSKSVFTYSKQK